MKCQNCEGTIIIPTNSQVGEIVFCPDCRSSFEIIKKDDSGFHIIPSEKEGMDWGE